MTISLLFDIIGFMGVGVLLLAFQLAQTGKIAPTQMAYPLLNLGGATLLLISLLYHWNTASVFFELCWIAISLYGIWKIHKDRRRNAE